MSPTAPKHEWGIADALVKRAEQERRLRAHGDDYRLNAAFKVTAIRMLMSCTRGQVDFMEQQSKSKHRDEHCDAMFDDLYSKVHEYAQQRRLDEATRTSRGDPMDRAAASISMGE